MKSLIAPVIFLSVIIVQQPAQNQQVPLTAQQKLEQTCSSLKAGNIKNPPAELTATCQTLEDEKTKNDEDAKTQAEFETGKYCGAPWAPNTSQIIRTRLQFIKLTPTITRQYGVRHITYYTVKSSIINAWTINLENRSIVCIPTAMVDFMSSDGELAFIIGHETGHVVDDACKKTKQVNRDIQIQRTCELRADAVGFDLLVKSGFSPEEAGGAFGKLEMMSGDIRTDRQAQNQALNRDHPMTPERIQQMHNMLIQYKKVLNGPLSK